MKNTSKIALGAIITGLSVALMLSTAIFPFLSYAVPAITGALIIIMVMESDKKWAFLVFACVSILSVLIVPDKSAGAAYVFIFGYYPILKSVFEEKLPVWLSVLAKLLIFNSVLLVGYYISLYFFGIDTEGIEWAVPYLKKWFIVPIIVVFGSVFFLMYDTVLTRLVILYNRRWRKKFRKILK